jgi:tRNA nucleotidyltransferase/poly(A) polymerase
MKNLLPISLNVLIDELQNTGWVNALISKSKLCLVGGIVRDAFMNKDSDDVDLICIGLDYEEIKNILEPFGKVVIGGESFSVMKFIPFGHKGKPFDIAVPRIDVKIGDGHKGFEIKTDGVTLEEDLKRRDFTINSMAVDIKDRVLIDPFGGILDFMKGVLKATDVTAFIEDPLRIFRAIQFSCRFHMQIADSTKLLMKENAHLITQISGERIHKEFMKIFKHKGDAGMTLLLIKEVGIDMVWFNTTFELIENYGSINNPDYISFFWMLPKLGGVDPHNFYMETIKGLFKVGKALKVMSTLMNPGLFWMDDLNLKYEIFKALKVSSLIVDAKILPSRIGRLIYLMKSGYIPMYSQDIMITGDDVKDVTGLKSGLVIGELIKKITLDALSNQFEWKDREKSLIYLKENYGE